MLTIFAAIWPIVASIVRSLKLLMSGSDSEAENYGVKTSKASGVRCKVEHDRNLTDSVQMNQPFCISCQIS